MGNIFDERRDSELVQRRDKMSLTSAPPEQPTPKAPPAPPQGSKPEAPTQQEQAPPPQPFQSAIPFVPPVGYGVVPSSALSFDRQRDFFQAQEQAAVDENVQAILPLVQQQTFTNPYTDLTMNSGEAATRARQWQDQFNGSLQREWDSYVTYSNQGVSPATQFDEAGRPIKQATETEIRQGLNGLTSGLGRSLNNLVNNDGWFGNAVNTAWGAVTFGTRAVKDIASVGVASLLDLPGVNQTADSIAEYLFSGDPQAAKQHERWIKRQKLLWNGGGIASRGERRERILQQAPVRNSITDFDDNTLGGIFYTLSLPENLVMGAVYEFADGFRRLRGQDPGVNPGGRIARALYGQDLSIVNRNSSEKYLSWMEPEGVRPGDRTGNIFWDAPENLQTTLGMIGLVPDDPRQQKNQLQWLHWAMQAAPTAAVSMFVDPPIDFALDKLGKLNKGAQKGADILETSATVPGKLPTSVGDDVAELAAPPPQVPGMRTAQEATTELEFTTPDRPTTTPTLADPWTSSVTVPTAAGDTVSLPAPEFPYVTVKAAPSAVTPNRSSADVIAQTLTPGAPARPIDPVDITLVRRTNEDIARFGNRYGVKPETVVMTDAEVRMLQRGDSEAWARWGKPISPYVETADALVLPGGRTVSIGDVYPREMGLPEVPTSQDFIAQYEKAVLEGRTLETEIAQASDPEQIGQLLARKEINNRVQAMLRDSVDPRTAFTENVHLLPPSLNPPGVVPPQVTDFGAQYVETLLRLEDTAANMKALDIEFDSLRTVEEFVESRLASLPDLGRQDFQDIQATRAMYGEDDLSRRPLTQDVPSTFDDTALEQRLGELELQKAELEVQAQQLDNPLINQAREQINQIRTKRSAVAGEDTLESIQAKIDELNAKMEDADGRAYDALSRRMDKLLDRQVELKASDNSLLDQLDGLLVQLNESDLDTATLDNLVNNIRRTLTKEYNSIELGKVVKYLEEMVQAHGKRQVSEVPQLLEEVVLETENIKNNRPLPQREVQIEEDPALVAQREYFANLGKKQPTSTRKTTLTSTEDLDFVRQFQADFPERDARFYIADVRERYPEMSREELDRLLKGMQNDGYVNLMPFNDPQELTPRHRAASIPHTGDEMENLTIGYVLPKAAPDADPISRIHQLSGDPPARLVDEEALERELIAKFDNPLDVLDSPEYRTGVLPNRKQDWDFRLKGIDAEVEVTGKISYTGRTSLESMRRSVLNEADVLGEAETARYLDAIDSRLGKQAPHQKTTSKYPTAPTKDGLPVAIIGDDYWQHGTRSVGDVRTWVPKHGSGAHELGLGVYFTQDRLVAEAAATKFNYRNVPMNINADFSANPHIKTVSTANMQYVLDLNHGLTKGEFNNTFGEVISKYFDDPATESRFWKHFKNGYDGEVGYIFDAFREFQASELGMSDDFINRLFQEDMYDVLRKYDGGVFTGKNGTSTLVVYNPTRLINVDVDTVKHGLVDDVTPPTPKPPELGTAQPTPGTVDVTAQTVDPTVTPESPGFKFNKKPEMYNAMDDLSTGGDDVATMGTRPGDDMPVADPYSVMDVTGGDDVDEFVEALEAQRFLDQYTAQAMPTQSNQVRHLESTQEAIQYQQQRVAEAMGEEFTRHSEDLETLLETQEALHRASRAQTEKLITEYDPSTAATTAFRNATSQVGDTDLIGEAMSRNKQFKKFRTRLEKKLDKLHKKLLNVGINSKEHDRLLAEIAELTQKVSDIDSGFSHQIRVMKALSAQNPTHGVDWRSMQEFQKLANLQNLNPGWWEAKGNWLARSAFEKARNRVQTFAARYIDSALGGDFGKVRDQLFNLKRVGQGEFAAGLANMEAASRIKKTWKEAQDYIRKSGVKIPKYKMDELLSELMEIQASPYLMDEQFANTQVAKFLQAKLAETFQLGKSLGFEEFQLDELSDIVREIPQVYHEVRDLSVKMGLNFGDEITLGYLPRELKETVMFMIGEHGVKHSADASDNLRKSRTLFHYVPEDSALMEQILDQANGKWREVLNVKSFDELLGGDDSKLLGALNGILTDEDFDMLNELGVLRKIPFTQVESAKFIAQKYDLPFNNLSRIYLSDPQEAFQLYKKGLQDRAAKAGVANGLVGNIGEVGYHTLNPEDVPNGWVKFGDIGLRDYVPQEMAEYMDNFYVHPFVADEMNAMFFVQTNPGVLSMVGDVLNTLYKYSAGAMLSTPRWFTMQLLGNLTNVVKRSINPQLYTGNLWTQVVAGAKGVDAGALMRTSKEYMGGQYSQKELWNLGVKLGLVDVDVHVYGTAAASGKFLPGESASEFLNYLRRGGYHREFAEGVKVSRDPILKGVVDRLLSGANSVMDSSMYRFLDLGNKWTDNALRFALFEAVTKDDAGWVRHIPGFNPRVFNNLPHFTDPVKAAEWVRQASYTFDQVGTNENIMRYIMPFWTFQRLSFAETARWVAANPAKFSGYVHLVSATQNNFEEQDSAAWEALMGSGWMAESMPIPVKIPADISASGEDEYYVYPLATLSPSAGALGLPAKVANIFGFDPSGQERSPKDAKGNPYSGKAQSLAEFMRQDGSPFARTILSVFDPSFVDQFATKDDSAVEERTNYPLGLSRTSWALTKLWAPWANTLVKLTPESVKGRPARVNPRTGEYNEGTPDIMGNVPTTLIGGNIYGNRGWFDGFLQVVGAAPVSFDVLLQQGFSMTEIKSQLFQLEKDAKRIHSLLRNPQAGYKKEDLERQLAELQIVSLHLRSQYDIYREWRRLNDLPHPRALKQIETSNLKVDKLLPEAERQRIYRENWERYSKQFL